MGSMHSPMCHNALHEIDSKINRGLRCCSAKAPSKNERPTRSFSEECVKEHECLSPPKFLIPLPTVSIRPATSTCDFKPERRECVHTIAFDQPPTSPKREARKRREKRRQQERPQLPPFSPRATPWRKQATRMATAKDCRLKRESATPCAVRTLTGIPSSHEEIQVDKAIVASRSRDGCNGSPVAGAHCNNMTENNANSTNTIHTAFSFEEEMSSSTMDMEVSMAEHESNLDKYYWSSVM